MKVFYISGHHASGKTFTATQLVARLNIEHFECSAVLKKNKNLTHPEMHTLEWIKLNEKKYGKDFGPKTFCELIKPVINSTNCDAIIITGCRSIKTINYINKYFNFNDFHVLFYYADFLLLKQSYESRQNVKTTDKEFKKILHSEVKRGIHSIEKYVKNNPKSCREFIRKENGTKIIDETEKYIISKTN